MSGSNAFSAPTAVAGYLDNLERNVPGVAVLHRLVDQILTESVGEEGRLLVVGAGGGAELAHLAERHAGWRFHGVDPSGPMLELAKETMGEHASRATLQEGYVADAPEGPYDAATCLLTLHFLPWDERVSTLAEIHSRMRSGAPLLTFHHSVRRGPRRLASFERSARYALGREADEAVRSRAAAMAEHLPVLSPEEDESALARAGFRDGATFYSALTMRGWVAYA